MTSSVYRRIEINPAIYKEDFYEDKPQPARVLIKADGLPYHLSWFGAQIAGHKTQVAKDGQQQLGFIKDKFYPARILKPVMNDKRGKREKNFYEDVFNHTADLSLKVFRSVIPEFYGLRDLDFKGDTHELLELEDVTEYFKVPAVIDIKIGQRTWGPDANEEKIQKERVKCPQQEQIGFRILGYKVEGKGGQVAARDRESCLSLMPEEIEDAIADYLSHRSKDQQKIMDSILYQLDEVRDAMAMGVYHFFSSSILIAYETDPSAEPRVEVRMIDFSHVFNGDGRPDANYLYGLDELSRHVTNIRNRS